MKILAFAATSNTKSINKKLAIYTANLLENAEVEVLDINDFELPLYSEDKQAEIGKPQLARDFLDKIGGCDAIVVSYAEHNGSYTAAFKNLFDWCSLFGKEVYQGKKMVLLSTSTGPSGAASVLAQAVNSSPFFAGDIKGSVSVPSFNENFDSATGKITNPDIKAQLVEAMENLL
ncbi:MAG: NADPH-dependent FMN reductase [Rhodospirillaceae bacterium]|nr:MAG: NADPH-dependent FMN reductase [Rhodospirillaceae bacterium]